MPTALVCAALLAPGAQAACGQQQDPEDPPVSIGVPTLSVTLEPQQVSYRRGERARVVVRVNQLTSDGPKTDGATVSVTLKHGAQVLAKLAGKTSNGGAVTLRFVVGRYWPGGTTAGAATAKLEAVPGYDCRAPLVYQGGERQVEQLFRIRG